MLSDGTCNAKESGEDRVGTAGEKPLLPVAAGRWDGTEKRPVQHGDPRGLVHNGNELG